VSWDGLTHSEVRYGESELDTRRFGIDVARLTVGEGASGVEADVVAAVEGSSSRVIVARWPARMTGMGGLAASLDRRVIAADTLTYWDVSVADLLSRTTASSDLETSSGVVDGELDSVLADSFEGYPSHYSANPAFPAGLVLEGYLEWAHRTLATRPDDVVVLRREGRAIGVATCAHGGDGAFVEIELAGLVSAEQGGGRYATLLRGVGLLARERGASRVVISTQASNVRVQRAWSRAGFAPFAAFTTVHLVKDPDG
jgi:hypothetical protein